MGLGFFNGDTKKKPGKRQAVALECTPGEPKCALCGLDQHCNKPKMRVTGTGERGILIIAEAPGEQEDKYGVQLIGPAGDVLRKMLVENGLDLDRDFWKINTINCRPWERNAKNEVVNRKPTDNEIACCWPMVLQTIEELKPKSIWLMGGVALETFFRGRVKNDRLSVGAMRRHCIPDKRTGAWVITQFHPSYLLQSGHGFGGVNKNLEALMKLDLSWAISCSTRPAPKFYDFEKGINRLTDFTAVTTTLKRILQLPAGNIVIDYETSGKKPYRPGHKIYTCCVALSPWEVYAFPYQYPHWTEEQFKVIQGLWVEILKTLYLRKIAHNIKFEQKWGQYIFGTETIGWLWDSMLSQHLLDTRNYQTRLEFQAFVRWGQEDWGTAIEPFKKAEDKGEFNKLYQVPLMDLLLYTGMDGATEYKLFEEQQVNYRRQDDLAQMYHIFHEGTLTFNDMENEGIPVNEQYYIEEDARLGGQITQLETQLYNSREGKAFEAQTGHKIDLDSSKDLGVLFYGVMNEKVTKLTEKAKKPSVDEEALNKMKNSFAINLVQYRKISKTKGTYLAQFKREIFEGKLHPFYDLNIAETGRSNSNSPNFQNIPIRDEESKKSVRSGIMPRFWHETTESLWEELMEADYKSIEVRIMACYSHDPNLIRYIEDPTTDMHRDQACQIFIVGPELITDTMRHASKNGFVFPEFYGDWFKACARYIWDMIEGQNMKDGTPVFQHLYDKGIKKFGDFENHMQQVESRFWKHLQVTKDWRDDVVDFYQRKGYVPTFFGFRRSGFLSRNQVVNAPVQGTAFHCLLWACNRLNRIRKEEKWISSFLGQIHDSLLTSVNQQERQHVLKTMHRVMVDELVVEHPWIIVPMEVEFESTGIRGCWANKSKIKDAFCGRTRKPT